MFLLMLRFQFVVIANLLGWSSASHPPGMLPSRIWDTHLKMCWGGLLVTGSHRETLRCCTHSWQSFVPALTSGWGPATSPGGFQGVELLHLGGGSHVSTPSSPSGSPRLSDWLCSLSLAFLNHSEKTIGHLSLRQNGGSFPRGAEKTGYQVSGCF